MFERISLFVGRALTVSLDDLKREDGQGATEYAMVIGFLVVTLALTIAALGGSISDFLTGVGNKLEALIPS